MKRAHIESGDFQTTIDLVLIVKAGSELRDSTHWQLQ